MSDENTIEEIAESPPMLIEGRDFVMDNALMVLTRQYLLSRGYCCGNGCRNCPYDDACTGELE
jgi:hypothetical protein